jgi:transposase
VVNKKALVADRQAGLSLTTVAKRYGVSRASVVRFTREAQGTASGEESRWSNLGSGVQQASRPRSRAQR